MERERSVSCSENVNVIKEPLQVTIKSSSSWFISEAVWFSVPKGAVSAGAGRNPGLSSGCTFSSQERAISFLPAAECCRHCRQ